MSEDESLFIFYQMVRGLCFLHKKGICHRDLKPENVMYQPSTKTIKIIDFGFAKIN